MFWNQTYEQNPALNKKICLKPQPRIQPKYHQQKQEASFQRNLVLTITIKYLMMTTIGMC